MLRFITCCYPRRSSTPDTSEPPQMKSMSADMRTISSTPPTLFLSDTSLNAYASGKRLSDRHVCVSQLDKESRDTLEGMKWGLDAVANDDLQGLPRESLEEILAATEKRGYVFSHRPVAPLSRRPIAEGNPTKPFAIKGKSADAGFQQSFICIDQNYSKLAGVASPEEIAKGNKDVASISSEYAIPQPLRISTERVQELANLPGGGLVQTGEIKDKKSGTHMLTFKVFPKHSEPYEQVLSYNKNDGYWYVNIVVDGDIKPLEVLCHPENMMPITADVDPLFEAYPWEVVDFSHTDKLPVPMISFKEVKSRIETYKQKEQRKKSLEENPGIEEMARREKVSHTLETLENDVALKHFLAKEDPAIGNVSPRVKGMIDHYGQSSITAIDRKHPLVHHNIDATSPFSKEKDNYPATLYFPKWVVDKIPELNNRSEPIVMAHTPEQLEVIIQLLKDNGMFMYITPDWKELAAVRSNQFRKSSSLLKEHMSRVHARSISPKG